MKMRNIENNDELIRNMYSIHHGVRSTLKSGGGVGGHRRSVTQKFFGAQLKTALFKFLKKLNNFKKF